jgi:hypothetical protein
MIIRYIHVIILYGLIASSSYSDLGAYIVANSTFVTELMTDKAVLPRARAIYLARILCRTDIVAHLFQHGRNMRAGQLPAHMRAVFVATERAMRGLRPAENVARAERRHNQTGVTREQRLFVWAAGVDAYITAARLAGYKPTERELWNYHSASLGFGRLFGVDGNGHVAVNQTEALVTRLMGRIRPDSVQAGGWVGLMWVTSVDWFLRDSTISPADAMRAVEETIPTAFLAAMRRS